MEKLKNVTKLLLLMTLILGHSCGDNSKTSFPSCTVADGIISCPDGTSSELPKDPEQCTVQEVVDGAIISCGNSMVKIKNGSDGKNGADGVTPLPSPYDITEIIDPCGDDPNHADEIILKLYDGSYLVYFEDGGRRFLSLLEHGKTYQTTDRQKCKFMITSNGNYQEI